MKTIMVTGSTSGLGLQIVAQLAEIADMKVIMAVRNLEKGQEIARQLGQNVSAIHLDLSKLGNVSAFVKKWDVKLDALVNNAGVQFSNQENFTEDFFEETVAVNHLAAFLLTKGLEKHIAGGRVLFIGSGTHNPRHRVATMFGFRGAQYTSVHELAKGVSSSENPLQRNLDRYATSKFLSTVTAVEMARRNQSYQTFVLDPGLMPGTEISRTRSVVMKFLWKRIMPAAGVFLPDTSSPKRSASAAVWILTEQNICYPNGTIFSYNRKPCTHVWSEIVMNPEVGAEVYEQSLRITDKFFPGKMTEDIINKND